MAQIPAELWDACENGDGVHGVLLAVPDGWAKLGGRWVQLEPWTPSETPVRWSVVGED